jgi:hypothetical protein
LNEYYTVADNILLIKPLSMTYKINSEEDYRQVMEKIETYLQKATKSGGFHTLASEERDNLQHLSRHRKKSPPPFLI